MKRLFVIPASLFFILSSCHFISHDRIRGNGNIKTENRTAGSFDGIEASGNINIYIKQDSAVSIRIEADENLMEHIEVKTEDGQLVIQPKDDADLSGTKDIKVYVSSPSFKKLEASGASEINGETVITNSETITIDISGASKANLELKAPKVSVDVSGASNVFLKGQTKDLSIEASGASHAKCIDLLSENVDADATGASSAEVFASVNLKADASGASHIYYKGEGNYVGNTSGAGSINKVQ